MWLKISILAFLATVSFQGGECFGLCRPKLCLSPFSVPSLSLPTSLGLPYGEPISDCGPQPMPLPVIQAPPVTAPTVEGPIIPLPSPPIPCPKTIAHRCVCTKTVVKPQLIQRCITVPTVQRYLKRTFTPIVENIAYKARPRCPPGAARAPVCMCGTRPPPPPAYAPAPPPAPLALPYSRIC